MRWRAVRVSPRYRDVTAIAVDPLHPQTIYAGTDAGVIKSLDGGLNWRMVNAAMGGHNRDRDYMQVNELLVDDRDSATVYASTGCAGVFKSIDGGHSWASANAGLQPRCPWSYALALNPRAPRIIYAADAIRGVLKSDDGGARWQTTNTGLSLSTIFSVAADYAGRIAGAGRQYPVRHRQPGLQPHLGEHVEHGVAATRTDVVDGSRRSGAQPLDREDVGVGQIRDVYVVPDPGPVRGRMIAAGDRHGCPDLDGPEDAREQVR